MRIDRDKPARRTFMSTDYEKPTPDRLLKGEGEPIMQFLAWAAVILAGAGALTALIHYL